jgi:ABC-type multidrug transport system fused ATPase/permease subunit
MSDDQAETKPTHPRSAARDAAVGRRRREVGASSRRYRKYRKERGLLGLGKTEEERRKQAKDKTGKDKPRRSLPYYLVRYLKTIAQFRSYVVALIVLGVVGLLFRAVLPWTSKFMIDFVLAKGQLLLLFGTCAVLFAVALGDVIIASASEYVSRLLSAKLTVFVRRKLMDHLEAMPLDKLDALKTGGVISRLEGDTASISDLLYEGLLTPMAGLLMFVIAIGSLALISPMITLVCCCFSLLLFGVAYFVFNTMRPLFRDIREDIAQISGRLAETFGGIRVVRVFGRERAESRDFVTKHHLVMRKDLYTAAISITTHRSFYFIFWCMNIAIWGLGGYMAIQKNSMSIGDLVVFIRFIHWFFEPVFMIMHSLSRIQNSVACAERVFDLLDEEVTLKDKPESVPVTRVEQGFRFEDVCFAYEQDKPVLKHVSLDIPRGATVALVGPSGAGKTTIVNLLIRFYDVGEGRIALDGRDIRDCKLVEYRGLFSLVLQDVFLFDGTVAENIAYSRPEATLDEVEAAARAAYVHGFVSEFEDGYDTVIGERGVKLSGGQKQRISLARAILRDPHVLVLDEATSNLDSESEALIQQALRSIMHERTTVVIAHRLSTIMDADKIVVIDNGRIVEEGPHDELLQKRGKYWSMFTKQMEKARTPNTVFDWDAEANAPGTGEDAP